MLELSKISLSQSKGIFLAIFFCIVASSNAFSQSDKERNNPDFPKVNDSVNQYEGPESIIPEPKGDSYNKQYSQNPVKDPKSSQNNNLLRKENQLFKVGGEKEAKKEGMSTLSFNLFLYIVDKFKED